MEGLTQRLLDRVRLVRRDLGTEGTEPDDPQARLADLLDSMGLVEFLLLVASDYRTTPETIESCVARTFGTIAELAAAMQTAGLAKPAGSLPEVVHAVAPTTVSASPGPCWLGATAIRLPDAVQPAAQLNALLHRPPGWLERHAGLEGRCTWNGQDPLTAAAEAGQECLQRSGVRAEEVGTLLVTAEAPPLLAGLAAALHHRLGLRPNTPALEVGGACTGFLAALWLARTLVPARGTVLIVAVESPTRYLPVQPGPAGETAALFGDAAAACVMCRQAPNPAAVLVTDVVLGVDGGAGHLIQVGYAPGQAVAIHLQGEALAIQAVRTMAQAVRDLARTRGLAVDDLVAVIAHGGNGRMPALLARQLHLPPQRVWSETARTGNLGSASLPVAWAAHEPITDAPVAWTAVGAGLTWGAALTGVAVSE